MNLRIKNYVFTTWKDRCQKIVKLENRTKEQLSEQQYLINVIKEEFRLSNRAFCTSFKEELLEIQSKGYSVNKLVEIIKIHKGKIKEIINRKNTYNNEIMTAFGVLYLAYGHARII